MSHLPFRYLNCCVWLLIFMCKVAAYYFLFSCARLLRIFVRIIVNAQGCRVYLLELLLMRKVAAYILIIMRKVAACEPVHLAAGPGAASAVPAHSLHRHRHHLVCLQEGKLELDLAGDKIIPPIQCWGSGSIVKCTDPDPSLFLIKMMRILK